MYESTLIYLMNTCGQLSHAIFSEYLYFSKRNVPIHRARIVREFKLQNNIHSMVWLAQSPDLNVLENVWLTLKRELKMGTILTHKKRKNWR